MTSLQMVIDFPKNSDMSLLFVIVFSHVCLQWKLIHLVCASLCVGMFAREKQSHVSQCIHTRRVPEANQFFSLNLMMLASTLESDQCGFCNIGLQLPNLSFEKNATATSQFSKIGKVSIHGTWTILNYLGYKYQPSFPLFETESPLTYRHRMFKPGKTKCYHYMITIQS